MNCCAKLNQRFTDPVNLWPLAEVRDAYRQKWPVDRQFCGRTDDTLEETCLLMYEVFKGFTQKTLVKLFL